MKQTSPETDFADVFVCSEQSDWHEYYYISPHPPQPQALWYCVNRTGIERRLPRLFRVARKASTPYCQIFCILSGRGTLQYRGSTWPLKDNQIVLLCSGEPHSYESDSQNPLGMLWLEFYGGDSQRLVQHILTQHGPVMEGMVFSTVCQALAHVQQLLMADERYRPSSELYGLLWLLLRQELEGAPPADWAQQRFARVEAYMEAHLNEPISNSQLAALWGVSLPYFTKQFKAQYHTTPQAYLMNRRITKSKYLLTQTGMSVEAISAQLGFCNPSHFIRRFQQLEGMSPAAYRKGFGQFRAQT